MKKYLPEIYFLGTLTALVLALFFMQPALMPFFLGSAFAYISHPLFKFFLKITDGKKKISAVLTLTSILLAIFVVLFIILPTVISQVQSFIEFLPHLIEKVDAFIYSFLGKHFLKKLSPSTLTLQSVIKSLYVQLGSLPIGNLIQRIFSGVFSAINVAINAVLVPLITYYMLVNAEKIKNLYLIISPNSIQEELKNLIDKVHNALSSYLIGQIFVAIFVGIYIAIGLYIVKIKYAFLIGFIAGVLNMLPYVGFFSGLIPSILLAIFDNGTLTAVIGVLIVFLTEVGLENLIYPIIMSRTTGINPLLILFSIFVGGYLGGVLGVILAVPIAVIVVPVFDSFVEKKENKSVNWSNG